jgi:hypothetical protein
MCRFRNGLKQGDVYRHFSTLLRVRFRRVQENQDGLKLNDIHQFLFDVDIIFRKKLRAD